MGRTSQDHPFCVVLGRLETLENEQDVSRPPVVVVLGRLETLGNGRLLVSQDAAGRLKTTSLVN